MVVATERSSLGAVSTGDAASGARSRFCQVFLRLSFSPRAPPGTHHASSAVGSGSLLERKRAMSGCFFVHTFGCQMNVHDSDRMQDVLIAHGWTAAPSLAAADLVVFNTCSVRETAENKLRIEIDKLRPLKR